jgi:hypothetical protein
MSEYSDIRDVLVEIDNSCPSCYPKPLGVWEGIGGYERYCSKHLIWLYRNLTTEEMRKEIFGKALSRELKRRDLLVVVK